ncbi:DUF2087 domain-containing protein [Microbacterium hominis]|uniref:DUF2087 domain-containing protein n=1 Tax=Microbacterium hominis TaxID=162426 RepID=A0A7D4PXT7_9MICO|nr:DUF2087 domain-containing protein [Microbacterium hominis]
MFRARLRCAVDVLTERELDERLASVTDDVALIRRHLVDHRELERTRSGSEHAHPADAVPED